MGHILTLTFTTLATTPRPTLTSAATQELSTSAEFTLVISKGDTFSFFSSKEANTTTLWTTQPSSLNPRMFTLHTTQLMQDGLVAMATPTILLGQFQEVLLSETN